MREYEDGDVGGTILFAFMLGFALATFLVAMIYLGMRLV